MFFLVKEFLNLFWVGYDVEIIEVVVVNGGVRVIVFGY